MTSKDLNHKGAKPFEQSAVFTITRIGSQIEVCDNLLSRLSDLEERKSELVYGERRLSDKAREIDEQHLSQIEEASDAVSLAQGTLFRAEADAKQLQLLREQQQQRFEGLKSGQLSPEDIDHVKIAVEEKSKPVKTAISDLDSRILEAQGQIENIAGTIQAQKAELISFREDLETFENGDIPARYLETIEVVRRKSADDQDREIKLASDRLKDLTNQIDKAGNEIKILSPKIDELKASSLELENVSKQNLLNKFGSSAWRGSFFTNYEKEIQELTNKKNLLVKQRSNSKSKLTRIKKNHTSIITGRPQFIEEAVLAERTNQLSICQDMVDAIPITIREGKGELASIKTGLRSLEDQLEIKRQELKLVTELAVETAKNELVEMVKASLDELSLAIVAAGKNIAIANNQRTEANETLEQLRTRLSEEKSKQLLNIAEPLDELNKAIPIDEEQLINDAKEHGIEGSVINIREAIVAMRSGLVCERQREQESLTLSEDSEIDNATSDEPSLLDVSQESESSTEEKSSQVNGNIYLDFAKNEDDNQTPHGKTYPGLRSQLEGLRRAHGKVLFQDAPPGADLLSIFIETVFPEGISQSYFICNLSLRADQPYLQIRPKMIGPRLERQLPRGISLAVSGKLWDNQRDADNPVFLVQKIVDLSHSAKLPFEQSISGFVFTQSQSVYPSSKRQENILSNDFVAQLPLISVVTKERLQGWRDYLDWRERLVSSRLVGLRYLDIEVLSDGRIRFLTVCESKENFDQVRRTLSSNELQAYGLNYSQDPWEFEYDDKQRPRRAELGDFAGQDELISPGDVDIDGMPWETPYFVYVDFRLPEESQNEFDRIINGGGTVEEAAQRYLSRVDSSGFLALSVVGDMILIKRQRSELQQLQEQSGHAPFLSSYLFDIKAASEPSKLKEINDNDWRQTSLNDEQRLAVKKMVSTPDLAMVQGPPGTGKTTMIAEATWQFIRDGKKVLLVSQASLAVNNVLERLAQVPAIRAIRLSRKERNNEREHPYNQANAIGTYYRSIAEACQCRTLDVWSSADERLEAVSKWIKSVDLVSGDMDSLRSKSDSLTNQRAVCKKELKRLKESDERARDIDQQKREVMALRSFIEGAASFAGTIPEPLLRVIYDRIVLPLDRLSEIGIRANVLWSEYDYGSLSERTRFAVEALLNWRKVAAFKSQINGDRDRLQATEGDSVLSSESAIRLAELQRKLQDTLKAMEEDDSKVFEYQAIQKEIREVKRKGSGLDMDIYVCLFNAPDNKSLSILTNAGSMRTQVVETLDAAYALLMEIEAEIEDGCREVCSELGRFIDSLASTEVDKDEMRRLEGQLRHLTERQKELSSDLFAKEKRLSDILSERSENLSGVKLDNGELQSLRAMAERDRDSLAESLKQSRSFRDSWGDVLQRWVSDLTDPETVKCDQDNFLPTYINACNVVGVTCTERRNTLEDAGHTWFDAVIVDEVSKATPTEIIMPLMMGRTAILVGDHRQLPPLFKEQEGSWEEAIADQEESNEEDQNSDSELTAENFDRFKKMVTSSLFKEHFENAPDSLKSFLFTQYRMHPQIMRVVNQFYENRLICGLSDPDGKNPDSDPRGHRVHGLTLQGEKDQRYIVPEQHVAWIDSTLDPHGKRHYESSKLGSSKVNELEWILIAKSLFDIEMACRDKGFGANDKPPKQVGIVTFYNGQKNAIKRAVKRIESVRKTRFSAIDWDVNTVDRYQGQERPIILVSMVRSPPFKLSQRANTAQFERINVAFSRAEELLVVVGAKDVFCKYPVFLPHLDKPGKRKVEVYRFIIDEIQRSGGLWSSDYIISSHEYDRLLPAGFSPKRSNGRPNQNNNRHRGRISK
ncbi:MAG: AAA family ATPase [Proteobacteria bacterium]|nr:AAA family ATPase [Pseudomonadota bacterium]